MKKFLVQISHTEYGAIEVEAEDGHRAEKIAYKNLDFVDWGNDETEITDVEEISDHNK